MVTVGLYYDVLPGKGPEFERKFFDVLEANHRVSAARDRASGVDPPSRTDRQRRWRLTDAALTGHREGACRQFGSTDGESVHRADVARRAIAVERGVLSQHTSRGAIEGNGFDCHRPEACR